LPPRRHLRGDAALGAEAIDAGITTVHDWRTPRGIDWAEAVLRALLVRAAAGAFVSNEPVIRTTG